WVENGVITLIGASTENPSFELTGALLSRCRVFVLEPLSDEHIRTVIGRALMEAGARSQEPGTALADDAVEAIVQHAQGDARRALNTLEAVLRHSSGSRLPAPISRDVVLQVLERPLPVYDKSGEQHFNLISALHKAVRGSDVEGALYWLARMLAGGEDPLYLARRLVRIASEDVGLADPRALTVALAAKDAYHFLGSPEGELALAEATIYLATAPKSNRVYAAFGRAMEAAREHPAEAVPLHIRNAPTGLMQDLGYGAGYKYAHDTEQAYAPQEYLPEALRGAKWYEPTEFGHEKTVKERIEWWEKLKREAGGGMRDA
ncbi:MAG TPA: replication-associated recombination protein A, partial [Gemmatimonadales bacterium]